MDMKPILTILTIFTIKLLPYFGGDEKALQPIKIIIEEFR